MSLSIKHVSKVFVNEKGEEVTALGDINLQVEEGEFICILGPSGCGKTTLLRIIAGLDAPSSGRAEINGKEIAGPAPELAMIFQEYSLYPWRTIIDNAAFGLEVRGVPKEERYAKAREYLDLVGLKEFESSHPYELSGGMRQRVAVARALCSEPQVLLMDEPFGALDAQTRNTMQKELLDIWKKTKKTVIFVTHSVDEAVYLSDRVVVLSPRPSDIREIVTVEQNRPRDRTSVEFAQVRRYVLSLIHNGSD
ncbi:NitT/TauT family transport system ATP-binding protein [Methanofollis sp. W23]|uniref:ABC transporter ATP-binding protein n=1 Tax=Methanofollis sp. W23 TaxID=2817849 RepID=UPI001AE33F97|nr:ABC transporter ATP-binding protein [Methanofollis sp. W23]MBP2144881.1 NitT/TauT family transport system ATP-binding protein [Methanofollis sp. W23]